MIGLTGIIFQSYAQTIPEELISGELACSLLEAKTCNTELVTNGDFESGNTGFSSDYSYVTAPCCCSTYSVVTNAFTFHSDWHVTGDKMPLPGSGKFFVGDADCAGGFDRAWYQNINVISGQLYIIQAWVANLDRAAYINEARITISFNGVILFSNYFTVPNTNDWNKICGAWLSSVSGSVEIAINAAPSDPTEGIIGADFGLDGISVKSSFDNLNPAFTYTPDASTLNLCSKINFNAVNDNYNHAWLFGDVAGGSSTQPNPSYTYPPVTAVYNVTHTIYNGSNSNGDLCDSSITLKVSVSCPLGRSYNNEDQIKYSLENKGTSFGKVTQSSMNSGIPITTTFPNPFNETTRIQVTVPEKTHLVLSVYDIYGKLVEKVLDNEVESGMNEITWSPLGKLSPGIYLLKTEYATGSSFHPILLNN